MHFTSDFLIIGAGIVGLTVALELKSRNPSASVVILDKETDIGKHASGRNSGVLHSGVFYGSDTLKAKVCSSGAASMLEFAQEHKIAFERSGKVIIATSERDLLTIDHLLENAKRNGVKAEHLDAKNIKEIEPYASPYLSGIYCPDTAIIDSKAIINKLRDLLKADGVKFEFNALVNEVDLKKRLVRTSAGNFSYEYTYNCAGAGADLIAKKFGLAEDYALIPFKGIYYKIRSERKYLVRSNIYPVPDSNLPFLGVHLTRVMSGDVYVGPTAIPALGRENYGIFKGIEFLEGAKILRELAGMYSENNQNFRYLVHTEIRKYLKPWFLESAKRLVNDLKSSDIELSEKVGIRPQLINTKTKTLEMDYILEKDTNSLHILNSISPAFTSSFAFAKWIVDYSSSG